MENLDDMIKKYAAALEFMGRTYGGEAEKTAEVLPKTENKEVLKKEENDTANTENELKLAEMPANDIENGADEGENETVNTEPAVNAPAVSFPEGEATSSALFSASVFSGEGVYPVEGARIVVYRGDNIYAFLETDATGSTKRVRLPAFEKENSLESENPDRSIEYSADVFAEGFISQKGLLVSSVGGSEILLRVLMVPESERIG